MSNRTKLRQSRVDDDDFEPVEIGGNDDAEPVEQVHLFSVDGTPYYIPRKVRFNLSLKAMKIFRAEGEVAATEYMLQQLLGEEGYEALTECEDLTKAQFDQVCEIARRIVLGNQEQQGKAR